MVWFGLVLCVCHEFCCYFGESLLVEVISKRTVLLRSPSGAASTFPTPHYLFALYLSVLKGEGQLGFALAEEMLSYLDFKVECFLQMCIDRCCSV